MARLGLPISMSHALIGGLVGALLVAGAAAHMNLHFIGTIVLWMVIAPVLGFVMGWALMLSLMWTLRNVTPYKINRHFRVLQIFSSGLMAFSHGANDAQKAMGIITLALVAAGVVKSTPHGGPHIPLWVITACASNDCPGNRTRRAPRDSHSRAQNH